MTISEGSIAAGNSVETSQAEFGSSVTRLGRKPFIVASYDPSKTGVIPNVLKEFQSADEVGAYSGFGFMSHMMASGFTRGWGANGKFFMILQEEESEWVKAAGSVSFEGTAGESKTLHGYISGIHTKTSVVKGMTPAQICTAFVATINGDKNLPVTAVVNGSVNTKADLTAKSKGLFGNGITIEFNLGLNETFPSLVVPTVVSMSGGTGVPDISDALNSLGTGALQNDDHMTCGAHGYELDTDTLDACDEYNGTSVTHTGNHDGEVSKFFQMITAANVAGSDGKTTIEAVTDLRVNDMTNCCVWRPGSPNHPAVIAATALGVVERQRIDHPESTYVDLELPGIMPGEKTDDYTGNSNLDDCVKNGISTTKRVGSKVVLQDVVTFFRPDSVSINSNSYRSMRNQAVIQNMAYNCKTRFNSEKWKNITIVKDKSQVTDNTARIKARMKSDVIGELISLVTGFAGIGFCFDKNFTIKLLTKKPDEYVSIRPGGKGFNYQLPFVLSGEGGIISGTIFVDSNVSVVA